MATLETTAPVDEIAQIGLRFDYVDSRFGQLHVTTDDSPEEAPALIMMNTRTRSLRKLLPLLRPHFRGVILDIPGSGNSTPPPDGSSMPDIAGCVVDYLDAAGIEAAHVFGFHTGHKVATALASHHPERVEKLIVAGKTHSLLPDREARNASMQNYLDRRTPDTAIVMMEGKYLDDDGYQQHGFEAMFEANFAFDFAAALAAVRVETLVIEVTTKIEVDAYGLQGPKLVAPMADGRAVDVAEIEPTGIEMYIGTAPMADLIVGFMR